MLKELKEFPWYITDQGVIISKKTGKPRIFTKSNAGYYFVNYTSKNGTINRSVHRLVAETYIGEIPKGYCVNHKDGNKTNNRVSNLEIVTYKENIRHAHATGLRKGAPGETNSMSKLTDAKATQLIYDLLAGMTNDVAGEKYGLHPRYVSLIRHKRRWKTLWQSIEGSTTIESTRKSGSE